MVQDWTYTEKSNTKYHKTLIRKMEEDGGKYHVAKRYTCRDNKECTGDW